MKRIKFCNSIIEKLIMLLPLIFSVLVFVSLNTCFPILINHFKENGIQNTDILSYCIEVIIFLLSFIPFLFSHFKPLTKRIKATIYRKVLHTYLLCHNKFIGLFCRKIIHIFFKVKRLEVREQNQVVSKLFSLLNSVDDTPRLAFLTGSAYSGKTTTVLIFLEELILNRKYSSLYKKLDHKIYYYDFDSQFSFENFNNDYVSAKYDSSLLIIDNLHRESEDEFIQMINLLISAANKAYGIFVVFRRPEEFLINQTKAQTLYDSISEYCVDVDKSSLALNFVEKNNALINQGERIKFQSFLNSIGFSRRCYDEQSILYLHLYKIFIYYIKFNNKRVFDIFNVLQGKKKDTITYDALICIFILCQNIGKFTKDDYYYIMKKLGHRRVFSKVILSTLENINFIEQEGYEMNTKQYILHEELAKLYLQQILRDSNKTIIQVSKILFEKYHEKNLILAWHYSLFCRTIIKYDGIIFDIVLKNANIKNMLSSMRCFWEYIDTKDDTLCREYGVLNTIVGNGDIARQYLMKSFELNPKAETLLELFEVKHKYYLYYKNTIHNNFNHLTPYVRLGISYWDKHINMHFGEFDFNSYSSDALLILENAEWIQNHEPYRGLHMFRRWYFDYYKIFYLTGELNFKMINQSKGTALYYIKSLLKDKSNEFYHYNQVYVIADYIQYTILFKHRLYRTLPNRDEINFICINLGEKNHVTQNELYNYAIDLYDNTIQQMKKNGDTSFWHVINRKIDLLLQSDDCDFDEIIALLEYYMQHAFEIKCYEYVAYANMFLLKAKLIRQLILAHEYDYNIQIENHIQNFRKYYRKHNEFCENKYAAVRLRLFELLYQYQCVAISSKEFQKELSIISEISNKRNYQREIHIIKWIRKRNYQLSPGELKYLYQSYPIIIQ